jgi:DNA-binding beta-propeller fold protein YncE
MRASRSVPSLAVAGLLIAMTACDTGGPSFDVRFPFLTLQDVGTTGEPVACDFMGGPGSAIVAAGSHIYFIDHQMGYVLCDIDTGYPLTDICSTAEGGYAAAVYNQLLIYVSNETYIEHDPILLPASGLFVVAQPGGNVLWVVCSDGSVQTISTVPPWQVSDSHSTAVAQPSAVAVDLVSDGSLLYVADAADNTVKTLRTSDFSVLAEEEIPGGASDLCSDPLGGVWVATHSDGPPYELWHLDSGTGLHDGTIAVQADPISVAVTPDGEYFFVGTSGQTLVVDAGGVVQASDNGSYAPAADIAISGDGDRSVICQGGGQMKVWMLEKP